MQLAQYVREFHEPMMTRGSDDAWISALLNLIFLLVIAGIIVYAIRTLAGKSKSRSETRDPIDIAKERYAKGEITKEEFADIKKELK